jgi:hypothetical protein
MIGCPSPNWVLTISRLAHPVMSRCSTKPGTGSSYLGTLAPDSPFPVAFLADGRLIALEADTFDAPRMVAYAVSRH